MSLLRVQVTVILMLPVLPVPVTRDTLEMVHSVKVSMQKQL